MAVRDGLGVVDAVVIVVMVVVVVVVVVRDGTNTRRRLVAITIAMASTKRVTARVNGSINSRPVVKQPLKPKP